MEALKARLQHSLSLPEQLFGDNALVLTHLASQTRIVFTADAALLAWKAAALPPVRQAHGCRVGSPALMITLAGSARCVWQGGPSAGVAAAAAAGDLRSGQAGLRLVCSPVLQACMCGYCVQGADMVLPAAQDVHDPLRGHH